MREELLCFGRSSNKVGIYTGLDLYSESSELCAIFLNAGLIHKIGPNRLYVDMARDLTSLGISSFRFDFSGIGDSDDGVSQQNYADIQMDEIKEAMDAVQNRFQKENFILIGICSGAEIAFGYASHGDRRIVGLSLIDGVYTDKRLLKNAYQTAGRKTAVRYYLKNMFSLRRWIKVFSGKSGLFKLNNLLVLVQLIVLFAKKLIRKTPKPEKKQSPKIEITIDDWLKVFEQDIKTHLIFCEGDTAVDVYKLTIGPKLIPYQNSAFLSLDFLKDVDHTFTPVWSQVLLRKMVCDWVKEKYCAPITIDEEINNPILT